MILDVTQVGGGEKLWYRQVDGSRPSRRSKRVTGVVRDRSSAGSGARAGVGTVEAQCAAAISGTRSVVVKESKPI